MVVAAEDVVGGTCSIVTRNQAFHHRPVYYNFYDLSVTADPVNEQNIFATNRAHDLQLFVLRGRTATEPGRVRYCSTGYGSTPLYNWGNNPRVKAVFSSATTGLIVNDLTYNENSMIPGFSPYTNIYAGCKGPTSLLRTNFKDSVNILENLMVSAPRNKRYLSWDWAVGEWNVPDNANSPFSDFFKTNRMPFSFC